MSIQFPANPPLNDTFDYDGKTYIWDGEKWTASISNSFDDAYVNIDGDTMTGDLTVPSLNGGPLAGFRNQLINGDFRVWQRNNGSSYITVPAVGGYLGPDRWFFEGPTTSGSVKFDKNKASTGENLLRFSVTGATKRVGCHQVIEAQNLVYGQQYTLSFYSTATYPAGTITSYDSTDSPKDLNPNSGGWEMTDLGNDRWSVTFTYTTANGAVNSDSERGLTIGIYCNGLTYPADGLYQFWNVQLEPGSVATPFEMRPISTELALCQRYYVTSTSHIDAAIINTDNTQTRSAHITFPTTMRATPTISAVGTVAVTAFDSYPNTFGVRLYTTAVSPSNASAGFASWTADAEL